MPFENSCFISYRHTKGYKGRAYTERVVEDLKAELDLWVEQEVYRDVDRLQGADFYNEALARALCQSVCMVVLYWPTYFDQGHLFCAREFKAMEQLEQQRLQFLPPEERVHSLIIILALRGFERIPPDVTSRRLCKNFEHYTLRTNLREDPEFQAAVLEVGRYIADRCRAFLTAPASLCAGCNSFQLPSEDQVRPWVQQVSAPGLPFANREIVAP